jgi:hypothetical protein
MSYIGIYLREGPGAGSQTVDLFGKLFGTIGMF